MKKVKLILVCLPLLFVGKSLQAQLKYFFPDTNAYFSVSWMKFWFHGDTIIEDLKYKKVYMQRHDPIADFSKAHYFAAIREDTVTEKVYCTNPYYSSIPYHPLNEEREVLLYDFSVNIGDTVRFCSFWCWAPEIKELVIKSIDSIFIDNHYRKKINLVDDERDWNRQEEAWIEGIGSTKGLFFAGRFDIVDAMDWTRLLCVHIDGKLTYQDIDPFYDKYNCYIPEYVNIIENKEEALKMYPTIADNFLFIETDENIENLDYNIINVQGQIIYNGTCTSNIINVSSLSKGFYLIKILDSKNKKSKIQKFVKH